MSDPNDNFVAERWNWRAISPSMIPALLVPVVLALVLVGYVLVEAAN